MLRHIVFWKISPEGDNSKHREVCDQFQAKCAFLESVIPQFRRYRVACNTEARDEKNFHICIDSIFASKEDLEAYIIHPEHLKVREWLNSVTYDKTVFDYEY